MISTIYLMLSTLFLVTMVCLLIADIIFYIVADREFILDRWWTKLPLGGIVAWYLCGKPKL